jgi:hypothetical protein
MQVRLITPNDLSAFYTLFCEVSSDSELSNCIAENTGGRVYAASKASEVQRMLREATEEVASSPDCTGAKIP